MPRACLPLLFLLALASAMPAGATPPVVVFRVADAAGEPVAEACRLAWQEHGATLAAAILPATARADTVVCLVLDSAQFRRHFAGRLPDWGVGVAVPPGRLIALDRERVPRVRSGPAEVFLHEMAHALLMQATPGVYLPTWLQEGTAMRFSGEWRWQDTAGVIFEGRLPTLDRLTGPFPAVAAAADQAYRTSLLAVNLLERDFGPGAVVRIARAAADSSDFRAGFAAVTGEEVEDFQGRFAAAMSLRFGWMLELARWPTLFVLMTLLFLIGVVRRRIIARRRLREMTDEG